MSLWIAEGEAAGATVRTTADIAAAQVCWGVPPDDAALDAVAGGPDGLLAGLGPGTTWA